MKKHLLVKTALSGLFATLCTVGIVSFPGCQKQDYDYSEKDDLVPPYLMRRNWKNTSLLAPNIGKHQTHLQQNSAKSISQNSNLKKT